MEECRKYKERNLYKHEDYLIEIRVLHDGGKEAWLQHEDYGISQLMFGVESYFNGGQTYEQFKQMVESKLDEYIELYIEEYMYYD